MNNKLEKLRVTFIDQHHHADPSIIDKLQKENEQLKQIMKDVRNNLLYVDEDFNAFSVDAIRGFIMRACQELKVKK